MPKPSALARAVAPPAACRAAGCWPRPRQRPVRIRYHAGHRKAEAFDAEGRPLPAVMAYWFAWVAFHPQTELVAER
jgi:hypothetical protein